MTQHRDEDRPPRKGEYINDRVADASDMSNRCPPPTYPEGRRCGMCKCFLRRTNPGVYCAVCSRKQPDTGMIQRHYEMMLAKEREEARLIHPPPYKEPVEDDDD